MDKAQEKIAEGMYFSDRCQFCHEFGEKVEPYLCSSCLGKIRELGYCKIEGKPPLLSTEEIVTCMKKARVNTSISLMDMYKKERRLLIQAQRDSDIKWMR